MLSFLRASKRRDAHDRIPAVAISSPSQSRQIFPTMTLKPVFAALLLDAKQLASGETKRNEFAFRHETSLENQLLTCATQRDALRGTHSDKRYQFNS